MDQLQPDVHQHCNWFLSVACMTPGETIRENLKNAMITVHRPLTRKSFLQGESSYGGILKSTQFNMKLAKIHLDQKLQGTRAAASWRAAQRPVIQGQSGNSKGESDQTQTYRAKQYLSREIGKGKRILLARELIHLE